MGGRKKTCHPRRKSQEKRQMKTVKSKMWQRQEECSKGLSKKAGRKTDGQRWSLYTNTMARNSTSLRPSFSWNLLFSLLSYANAKIMKLLWSWLGHRVSGLWECRAPPPPPQKKKKVHKLCSKDQYRFNIFLSVFRLHQRHWELSLMTPK